MSRPEVHDRFGLPTLRHNLAQVTPDVPAADEGLAEARQDVGPVNDGLTRINLDELDRQGVPAEMGSSIAAALARTGLVEVRPEASAWWRLLPSGYVGAVRAGDLQVQVTPKEKVGLDRVLFLLGYARDPGFRPEDVTGIDEPDLWPALAESLVRLAERALNGGVLQGYRTVEESLRTIRGRIRIGDQIARRPGLMLPIEVTYDDFTTDIPENQILRTALRRLLAVPRLPAQVAVKLAHLDGRLTDIQLLRPGAPPPAWQPTGLTSATSQRCASRNSYFATCQPRPARAASWSQPSSFRCGRFSRTSSQRRSVKPCEHSLGGSELTLYTAAASMSLYLGTKLRRRSPWTSCTSSTISPPDFDLLKYKAADPLGRYPNADHYQMLADRTALVRTRRMARLRSGQWLTQNTADQEHQNQHRRIPPRPARLPARPATAGRRTCPPRMEPDKSRLRRITSRRTSASGAPR